ncbi:MAG: pantoate--beta-alanine ligase [Candidatus Kapabacteria bacterium]|nr:pantoate--beta-alanine ligase [Candidatus Kapabacteria bacterium]
MEIVRSIREMQEYTKKWRANNLSIAFVPTMGALHDGHLELMRVAKKTADVCIVSVFVNPLQFGPNEDFARYPRPIEKDIELCKTVGVDGVFLPEVHEIYSENFSTTVNVGVITEKFEGASRTSHFQGVTTIVAKLLLATNPDWMMMGQKDYQQVLVIKKMVSDLNFPVNVVMVPTKRDDDGLALSSRNKYLSDSERKTALQIRKALLVGKQLIDNGSKTSKSIEDAMQSVLQSVEGIRIDYCSVANAKTLEKKNELESKESVVLLIAAFVGTTRLIDNEVVDVH